MNFENMPELHWEVPATTWPWRWIGGGCAALYLNFRRLRWL